MLATRGGYTASSSRQTIRVNSSRSTKVRSRTNVSTFTATNARRKICIVPVATNVAQGSRQERRPVKRKNCYNRKEGCDWTGTEEELERHVNYDCLYQKVRCNVCKKTMFRGEVLGHRHTCPHRGCRWQGLCQETSRHLNLTFSRANWLKGCRQVSITCIHCEQLHKRGDLIEKLKKKLPSVALSWIYEATHEEASQRWFNIGLQLGLSHGTLSKIRQNFRDQCDDCYREMLASWLNREQPTAGDLVNGLKESSVGLYSLSEDFEKAVVCDDGVKIKSESTIEEAERVMATAKDQCKRMETLQRKLRTVNRKLERNKDELQHEQKQLKKRRKELQKAKGGDPNFFDYTKKKIREIEGTVGVSVDSIQELNDKIQQEMREREVLIQQIRQCKVDIDETKCKLITLKKELLRSSIKLEREEEQLIKKIQAILEISTGDLVALAGTALGALTGLAGIVVLSPVLAVVGPVVAVPGAKHLYDKLQNHPGEKEKTRIQAEYLELTRKCKMTAKHVATAIKSCRSNLENMKDLVYSDASSENLESEDSSSGESQSEDSSSREPKSEDSSPEDSETEDSNSGESESEDSGSGEPKSEDSSPEHSESESDSSSN